MSKNKEYDSLGAILKKADFELLLEKLEEYKKTDDIQILTEVTKGYHYSIADELLFHLPRFAFNKEENKLHPKSLEVVDKLLEYGANPNCSFSNGVTSFLLSCTVNDSEIVRRMLENPYKKEDIFKGVMEYKKADLNQGDGRGHKGLYYATMAEAFDVMDCLVRDYGVDINNQYFLSDNKTVLHIACQNIANEINVDPDGLRFIENFDIVKDRSIDKLIELGADPTIKDDYEAIPEELVPTFDPDVFEKDELSPEQLEGWDRVYEKVGKYRLEFEKTKKTKKLNF